MQASHKHTYNLNSLAFLLTRLFCCSSFTHATCEKRAKDSCDSAYCQNSVSDWCRSKHILKRLIIVKIVSGQMAYKPCNIITLHTAKFRRHAFKQRRHSWKHRLTGFEQRRTIPTDLSHTFISTFTSQSTG